MPRKYKKYHKQVAKCLCGCGREVRQYPSRPSKFYSHKCYLLYMARVKMMIEAEIHISLVSVGKNLRHDARY